MKLNLTKPLAFFDLETTGINIAQDRIVEISIVKVMPDGNEETKSMRINPTIPIPASTSAIHGIYDKDVADAPTFQEVCTELDLFLANCDLGGYNSNRFDVPLLLEEFLRAGVNFKLDDRKLIDAQRIFHMMERRTLEAAYKFYCDKDLENAHSAEADTRATYEVLKSQLDRYSDELQNDMAFLHDFTGDGDFVDPSRRMVYENNVPVFNFGKHKGKPVKEVFMREPQYYNWMMNSDFPLNTKQKLKEIKESM